MDQSPHPGARITARRPAITLVLRVEELSTIRCGIYTLKQELESVLGQRLTAMDEGLRPGLRGASIEPGVLIFKVENEPEFRARIR
jgi:hypothetical protein